MGARVALWGSTAWELGVLTWCTFKPVYDLLPQLTTLQQWLQAYGVASSNIDVWVATLVRTVVVLALVLAAPTTPTSAARYEPQATAHHPQLRSTVAVVATVFEALLMAKAATVAVLAPELAWPGSLPNVPVPHTKAPLSSSWIPSIHAHGGRFVGLVYMYSSIGVALLGSLVQAAAARGVIQGAQDKYAACGPPGGLEAPLLLPHRANGPDGKPGKAATGATANGKPATDQDEQQPDSKTALALLHFSSPDWPIVTAAFAAGTLAALGQACVPYLTGQAIDYASIEPDRSKFKHTILQLLAVAGACAVATGVRGGLFTIAMSRLNVRLRKALFHALIQMEVGFFDVTKTGEITGRLAADTTTVSDQVCLNLNVMLRSITQAAVVVCFMFAASWRLTVVTFIIVPVVMAISKVYGRYFAALAKKVQTELAAANSVAEEVLSTMTTVKAHAAQDSSEVAYARKLGEYFALLMKEALAYALYMAANTLLPICVSALVLLYGGDLVLSQQMSPGALVSFMLYQTSLSAAFQSLGDVFSALSAAVGAADKVLELMARTPQIDSRGRETPPTFQGHLELRDVHFAYPARPQQMVLRGLSLVVAPGQVVALVGPSGGGKSSIVKLVERFYLPQRGAVLLDGRDVGAYHEKWLRRHVALVSQEPVLYARSIRRNICYGLEVEDGVDSPPTQAEVEEAAKLANAHDFVLSFPDGYETECGEKGLQLSGGQKQRLAIARALVRRPALLLLDEATSALDSDSEAVVQEALDRVMSGRTVLVIAHRLSTVQGADRIIVIGDGVVQETGRHEELLLSGGVYATLVRRQIARSASAMSMSAASLPGRGSPSPSGM